MDSLDFSKILPDFFIFSRIFSYALIFFRSLFDYFSYFFISDCFVFFRNLLDSLRSFRVLSDFLRIWSDSFGFFRNFSDRYSQKSFVLYIPGSYQIFSDSLGFSRTLTLSFRILLDSCGVFRILWKFLKSV